MPHWGGPKGPGPGRLILESSQGAGGAFIALRLCLDKDFSIEILNFLLEVYFHEFPEACTLDTGAFRIWPILHNVSASPVCNQVTKIWILRVLEILCLAFSKAVRAEEKYWLKSGNRVSCLTSLQLKCNTWLLFLVLSLPVCQEGTFGRFWALL